MAVSAFQKVLNKLFKEFTLRMGREPQTPKEWMDLQNEAVRYFNLTKGKGITGSVRTSGGDVRPIADPTIGFKPRVIQGGKGIESLLETGDVKLGVAPKTTKKTLADKKDRHILFRDAEEDIARIKRENKQAMEDFKKKFHKKDFDPGGMASGGRIAMAGGGALKKFIEKLFIKASNDIRQGKGKFKDLDAKQRMVQHDNLTKKVMEFQKSGNTEGLEVYFDVNPHEAFAAAQAKVKKTVPEVSGIDDALKSDFEKAAGKKVDKNRKLTEEEWRDYVEDNSEHLSRYEEELTGNETIAELDDLIAESRAYEAEMYADYKSGALDKYVKPEVLEEQALRRQKNIDNVLAKAYDEVFYQKPVTGDYKYDADILSDSIAEQLGKGAFTDLPQTHQTQIYNTALKRITQDMKMKKTLKDVNQKIELQMFDPKDRKPNAEGGITRAGYFFGGPAKGSKALKAIMDAFRSNKTWGVGGPPYKPKATSFNIKEMTKRNLGTELSLSDLRDLSKSPLMERGGQTFNQFNQEFKIIKARILKEKLRESKIHGEAMISSAKQVPADNPTAKKVQAQFIREGKKQVEEATEGLREMDNYMGMIQKKGRTLHQSGGLAYMLGEPTYMKAEGGQVGHGPWTTGQVQQQPQQQQQAPRHPQQGQPNPMKIPQGIPSAAPRSMDPRVMQQQMMQRMMMGGMGQGQQPRMRAAEGGIKLGPLEIKPRASGSFTEGDYGPNEQRTWEDQIGAEATVDLPWGFELKGDYDKRRIKDRLYSSDDKYLDERVRADDDRWGLDLVWTKKFNQGGRVPMMYGGDPGFAFEYGGSWADWHDQHRNQMPVEDYIQTKLPKERLPFRHSAAGGGRIGFGLGSMSRRAFMKLMAGMTALPFIGKGVSKVAPKVIKEAEVIARTPDGMPAYLTDLIQVVKAKGTRDIIEGYKKSDYSTVHSYKGVDVIEDADGATRIKKDVEGGGTYTTDEGDVDSFDGITREIHMEIKPQYDEMIDPDSGVSWYKDADGKKVYEQKIPDEYFEGTVTPDMDGKMKDVVEEIDDLDHLELKKIADEAKDLLKIKKASGGLAHMLGA